MRHIGSFSLPENNVRAHPVIIVRMRPALAAFEDVGNLGVFHLKRFWSRTLIVRDAGLQADRDGCEWVNTNTLLCGLGLGLRETLSFVMDSSPDFERFERWVLEKNGGSIDPARIERLNAALTGRLDGHGDIGEPVLTEADLAFWEENGYVVLHDAVPPEQCQAAEQAIWQFLHMDRDNPDTWYGGPQGHSIWVPFLHHPALWANRNSPRIYKAFAQLWGRTDLWVTVDQAGLNPPERPGWLFPGPRLHWDMSLQMPVVFGVQGILYLTDTASNQGAFTCVPGFHRKIEAWIESLPPGTNPRELDLERLGPIPIAGRAGDLVIWHHALPHGSSPNGAARPRIVQYISMRPSQWERQAVWK